MSEPAPEMDDDADVDALAVELSLMREENKRLRQEHSRIKRHQYRRTAIGLGGIGILAILAGFLFPGQRAVLFSLGATGLFAAVLTAYLTPERFVSVSVGERIYDAHSGTIEELANTLGLSDTRLYVPIEDPHDAEGRAVRLFVPQWDAYELPADEVLRDVLVVPDDEGGRGLSVAAAGGSLLREVPDVRPSGDEPLVQMVDHLVETIIETFELVDGAEPDVDPYRGVASVSIEGSAFGDVDRFDHPVPSFLGAGLAMGTDAPVEVTVEEGDDRVDHRVQCTWDVESTNNP